MMDSRQGDTGKMTCDEYLELGLLYIREGRWTQAISCLTRAQNCYERQRQIIPAGLDSHMGLAIAMSGGDLGRAQQLCQVGLERDCYQPDFYFNLGKVYLIAKDKEEAVHAFQLGLQLDDEHRGIKREMKKIGIRKNPAIDSLPRDHFLNKYMGKIKKRLKPTDND